MIRFLLCALLLAAVSSQAATECRNTDHVLLSTGQQRFYYSYLGGPVFAASHGSERP